MGDDVLKFDDYHDRQADYDDLVRCARCGKRIPGSSTRCPRCGVHFDGEAQDFFHSSEQHRRPARNVPWIVAVAVLLVIVLVVGALGVR